MPAPFLLFLALGAAPPGREVLGQYGRWGAFRDAVPARCFAIAEPEGGRGDARPFVAIASWPGLRVRGQLHVRLPEPSRAGAPVLLEVGAISARLLAVGEDAWARDAGDDRRIVAAIRAGGRLRIRFTGSSGRHRVELVPLAGAASAIDAATIGCLPR